MNHNELKKGSEFNYKVFSLLLSLCGSRLVSVVGETTEQHHCKRLKSQQDFLLLFVSLGCGEIVAFTMFPCFLLLIELYSSFSFLFFLRSSYHHCRLLKAVQSIGIDCLGVWSGIEDHNFEGSFYETLSTFI